MPRYLGLMESNGRIDVGPDGLYEVCNVYAENMEEAADKIATEFNREGRFTIHGLASSGDFTSTKQTKLVASRITGVSDA